MKIEDYGFIGDLETGAIVGRDGSIDWLCFPRFDSAACFAKLLGEEKNGCWRIWPDAEIVATRRRYRGDTLILETDFETERGAVRLIDCMPVRGRNPDVVRVVEGLRGEVWMRLKLIIRYDFGNVVPWVHQTHEGLAAIAGPEALILRTPVQTHGEEMTTAAKFLVREGQRVPFVLTWYASHETPPAAVNAEHALQTTEKFWTEWSGRCTFHDGESCDAVRRSLITLKALTYRPTGGVLAAATTSLPEQIGGVRNWDYRFCWLRDATFTLHALMLAGYGEEAAAWRNWLLRAIAGNPSQTQIMYGPAGERRLPEFEVSWLPGYEKSAPVHVGNAAANQFQLDVYGEVMGSLHRALMLGIPAEENAWRLQRQLVLFVEEHWRDADDGIWEVRGARRNFTHSKVMAWVALDRAVRSVEEFGLDANGDLDRWRAVRDEIHREVCTRGFNQKRGAFTQYFGSENLDASLLMLPLVGFLPADDPRMRATIEAIERNLVADGFVLRYHPDASANVDGLPPGEGAFLPCSFWLSHCLALLGRRDDANAMFQRLLNIRNDLGLLSEEYDPHAKRLLGNFPQAFSHVGLVNTAHVLTENHEKVSTG